SWDDKYSALLEEIKTIANDITAAVEKNAGVTLQKSQTGEKSPLPSLERLHTGWVTVPAGYIVFLLSVAHGDCVEATVQSRANIDDSNGSGVPGWLCGCGVLLFEGVSFRTEPEGIPYISLPVATSPLE
ncbi:hypothetical protein PMIN03_012999, partial [Paraphaeosphaeria minitans]